jgi:hypothetical protein
MEVAETARGVAGMTLEVAETARGVAGMTLEVAETQPRAREGAEMLVRWSRSQEGEVAKVLGRWRWRRPREGEVAKVVGKVARVGRRMPRRSRWSEAGMAMEVAETARGVAGMTMEVAETARGVAGMTMEVAKTRG